MKTDTGSVALRQLISDVNCSRGAPMGRCDTGKLSDIKGRVYDRYVPMDRGDRAYDRGGAYWGIGHRLRVQYTADLKFIRFYREGEFDGK